MAYLLTFSTMLAQVIVVQESTLKQRTFPAVNAVVHPVKVVLLESVSVSIVTGAAAVIESASVGG
jgi:hypothetical protein